jgi:hypothetical protein
MWRRETRLAYWLSQDNKQGIPNTAGRFKEKILHQIHSVVSPCAIHTAWLGMEPSLINLERELTVQSEVLDGFSHVNPTPDSSQSDPWERNLSMTDSFEGAVYSLGLLDPKTAIRDVAPMNGERLRIHSGMLKISSPLHNIVLRDGKSAVRNIECQLHGSCPIENGRQWILKEAPVKSDLSKPSELSFERRSLDIDSLQDSERQGFLKEGEMMRHIPAERSELLAVFRSVPIEIITHLQYLDDKKMILYRISNEPRRTQTRLHDLAAIRDTADQEIHLVTHRAQYKTVLMQ